jgi:1-phosphatidylinositol-4-phosphate 5-kinase
LTIALKDNDFVAKKERFKVGGEIKKRLIDIINKDADFFARNEIIDYSLLVGVHNRAQHPDMTGQSRLNSIESEM